MRMTIRQLRRFRAQITEIEALEQMRAIQAASFIHMDDTHRERAMRDLRRRAGGDTFAGYRRIPKEQIGEYLKGSRMGHARG